MSENIRKLRFFAQTGSGDLKDGVKMKTWIFISVIVSAFLFTTIHASTEVVVIGGFGTDGATLESSPAPNSVQFAEQIYEALNVSPIDGSKKSLLTRICGLTEVPAAFQVYETRQF